MNMGIITLKLTMGMGLWGVWTVEIFWHYGQAVRTNCLVSITFKRKNNFFLKS